MQFEITLRTFAGRIKTSYEDRAAIRTTRPRYCSNHPGSARTKVIRRASRSALRRFSFSVSFFVFFLFFGITIAAVTVLAIHKRLRPSAAPDCNCSMLYDWFTTCLFPKCIQSERYKRPAHQSSPLKLSWDAA